MNEEQTGRPEGAASREVEPGPAPPGAAGWAGAGRAAALGNYTGHSYYGSLWTPRALARAAAAGGYGVAGVGDEGSLAAGVEFSQACAAEGLRPLLGVRWRVEGLGPVQATIATGAGYRAVCRGLTRWWASGELRVPRAEFLAFQEAHAGDLLFSVPVSDPRRPPGWSAGRDWRARWAAWRDGRRPELLWIELGWATPEERDLQRRIYQELAPGWTRWVLMTASRLQHPGETRALEVLQSIRTLTRVGQAHPEKVPANDSTLPAAGEWARRLARVPAVLEETARFAARGAFTLTHARLHLPHWSGRDGAGAVGAGDDDRRLAWVCARGLVERYRRHPWPPGPTRAERRERLARELAVVRETGYAGYFLIFHDVVRECRRRGIPLLARGSAAGSLICYTLGVSNVCPFRFGLSFERFLNLERMRHSKLPDIDLDLPWDRRDEIIRYLYERYGVRRVAMIGGCATFLARAAVAEVAKCLGLADHQARAWTRTLPHSRVASFLRREAEYVEARETASDERFRETVELARHLDELPRHPMMHPCGIVIADRPLTDFTPLLPSAKGYLMTQYDFEAVEDLGLLKLDLLGQAGLSVLRDCVANLAAQEGPGFDPFADLRYDDPTIFRLVQAGDVRGVFHIESPAMVGLLRMCRCADLDCLVATVSVIRPGAANEDKKRKFARRYLGLEPPRYLHPDLEPVLRDTFGLLVYEEHILFVANRFAGLDLGTADLLRRLLVKKKDEATLDRLGDVFRAGAARLGRRSEDTEAVWRELREFTGYMFNKAHGAAYAVEAYHGLWLKRAWPLAFYAAVLQNHRGFYQPLVYVLEIFRREGVFLLPEVTQPCSRYWVEGRTVQVPLGQIAGLSQGFLERWTARAAAAGSAPGGAPDPLFAGWADFLERLRPARADLLLLARAGALRAFFPNRHQAVWEALRAPTEAGPPAVLAESESPAFPPADPRQEAEWEAELLGFPVTVSPFALWLSGIDRGRCVASDQLARRVGREAEMAGLVVATRTHRTAGGELMKFVTLADEAGLAEIIFFPEAYRAHGARLFDRRAVRVRVAVNREETGEGFCLPVVGWPDDEPAVASWSTSDGPALPAGPSYPDPVGPGTMTGPRC